MAGEAFAEFEGGEEVEGFGGAEAFLFLDFGGGEAAEGGEAAVVFEEGAADVDGTEAWGAGAEEEGEELGVGEGAGAVAEHFFPGALFAGEVLDARGGGERAGRGGKSAGGLSQGVVARGMGRWHSGEVLCYPIAKNGAVATGKTGGGGRGEVWR